MISCDGPVLFLFPDLVELSYQMRAASCHSFPFIFLFIYSFFVRELNFWAVNIMGVFKWNNINLWSVRSDPHSSTCKYEYDGAFFKEYVQLCCKQGTKNGHNC